MWKVSFSDGLAISGGILAIVLLVLDKAGKLKGPALLVMLAIAACMAVPLCLSLPFISDVQAGAPKAARVLLTLFLLGAAWAGTVVWITSGQLPTPDKNHWDKAPQGEHLSRPPASETSQSDMGHGLNSSDLPIAARVVPQPTLIELPPPESLKRDEDLISRANILAQRLIDFADERDAVWNRFSEGYWQSFKVGNNANTKSWEDRDRDLNASQKQFEEEAANRVNQLYWPSVLKLTDDMAVAGVDISPISRVAATSGARLIGLRISMLATHVGKVPPFERVLTPLMAKAVVQGLRPANFEVWAFGRDSNSQRIAQNLREAMAKAGWDVGPSVHLFYPVQAPITRGIFVIYPFGDLASMDGISFALRSCGLDASTTVRENFTPNELPIKPDRTWGKVEIWPAPLQP